MPKGVNIFYEYLPYDTKVVQYVIKRRRRIISKIKRHNEYNNVKNYHEKDKDKNKVNSRGRPF